MVKGTEYEKYLTREPFEIFDMPSFIYKIDRPEIVKFDDQSALYASLAKGEGAEVDGIIDATDALMQKINDGAPFRIVGQPLTYTPSSIVVDRSDDALAATLREIIEAMHKDGTLNSTIDEVVRRRSQLSIDFSLTRDTTYAFVQRHAFLPTRGPHHSRANAPKT